MKTEEYIHHHSIVVLHGNDSLVPGKGQLHKLQSSKFCLCSVSKIEKKMDICTISFPTPFCLRYVYNDCEKRRR